MEKVLCFKWLSNIPQLQFYTIFQLSLYPQLTSIQMNLPFSLNKGSPLVSRMTQFSLFFLHNLFLCDSNEGAFPMTIRFRAISHALFTSNTVILCTLSIFLFSFSLKSYWLHSDWIQLEKGKRDDRTMTTILLTLLLTSNCILN